MCEDFLFDNVSGFITDLGTIHVENVKLTLQRKYILCRKNYSQFYCVIQPLIQLVYSKEEDVLGE